MPVISLPDGSQRHFAEPLSVLDLARSIGTGLAKAALIGRVDGREVDLSFVIDHDATVSIVTDKDPAALAVLRHSCAHLLAMAVKQLYPTAQVTIGPVVEDGFYYDFAYERPFTPDDLQRIEACMRELAAADTPVQRRVLPRDQAVAHFLACGERYKAEIIADIPADQEVSLYRQGDFEDLCRGPHIPSTGHLKAFKLTKVAGAFWRGDQSREQLQRIYGTCWANAKELAAYLQRIEEAQKRDHRKIGRQLELFHLQEEAPGAVFWHPKGWTLWKIIEQYMRDKLDHLGYQEIRTPQIVDRSLWERSGHWQHYRQAMFVTSVDEGSEQESAVRDFVVKPMNCPCHIQVFNQGLRSYRDLPMRLAEFGSCHRYEPSGALHGIMRVRGFTQDDAHIFCTEEQMRSETSAFIELLRAVYADFGFTDILYKLSTRPESRVGSDALWDKAEQALDAALREHDVSFELQPGEGAFYGPKIEFTLRDCLGRLWQCGTIQLDFNLPQRLSAEYVNERGERQTPVMLHRAVLGSFERFIGILIEHYAGWFPLWLAPVQVGVMNITDRQADYARQVQKKCLEAGWRVDLDLRNEKIGLKIREFTLQRVPYLLILGDKELEQGLVSVRTREGEDLGQMSLDALMQRMAAEAASRGR